MLKKYFTTLALSALFLTACSNPTPDSTQIPTPELEAEANELRVISTFYPIYDLTTKIAGSEVQVENLVPPGIEPHDYEPTPREIQKIYDADLLVYNGAGVDAWVDNLLTDLEKNNVTVLNMSETVTLLDAEEHEEVEGEHEESHEEEGHEDEGGGHEDEEGHDHGDLVHDPHFWLDPVLVQSQATAIRDTLVKLKPEAGPIFTANTEAVLKKLVVLDQTYQLGLQSCLQKQAIVTHNAFRYLEKRYDIDLLPISGLSPEEEPSARTLAQLADLSKKNNIKYVFFETLASPQLAETLANEIGAQTLVLNPLEGLTQEEQARGEDYFSVMESNLNHLKTALECH